MRGATDASLTVAPGQIIYEKKFGYVYAEPYSQLVSNSPAGLGLIHITPGENPNTLGMVSWEDNHVSVLITPGENPGVIIHIGSREWHHLCSRG